MEAVRKAMEVQKAEEIQDSRFKIQGSKKSEIQNPKTKINPLLVAHHSSLILGVHLEGPFLNPARCGALDKAYFLKPSLSYLNRLIDDYEDIIKIITIAPEVPGALKVIEKSRALGIKVNMGHSDATYKEAEAGKKAGASGITHIFNAMRPFHHREPGLAGFGLLDKDTYIEVIADGVHLHKETLRLIFSIKRHDRIILISDSVKGSGKGKKPVYKAKGILSGSGSTVSDSLKVLKGIGIPKNIILKAGIDNPGTYLHSS